MQEMPGYLTLDVMCSSKLTVFLKLCSQKTLRLSEKMMAVDKYRSVFFFCAEWSLFFNHLLSLSLEYTCKWPLANYWSNRTETFPGGGVSL